MELEEYEKVLTKLSPVKAMFLFLFWRRAFERLAEKHDIATNLTRNDDLRERYQRGEYKPDVKDTQRLVAFRTKSLRRSFLFSGLAVIGVGLLSGIFGFLLYLQIGICPHWLGVLLQASGVGIILWATLWELGWQVRSMGGHTLAERVHQWIFRAMYSAGSGLFFFAYVWSIPW